MVVPEFDSRSSTLGGLFAEPQQWGYAFRSPLNSVSLYEDSKKNTPPPPQKKKRNFVLRVQLMDSLRYIVSRYSHVLEGYQKQFLDHYKIE